MWLASTVAYSVGGILASAFIGASIAGFGAVAMPSQFDETFFLPILLGVCAAVLLRELRLIDLPLLQWRRQTSGLWAKVLPAPVAAGLWGIDLGLVFTTWLTFAGPWLLAAIAFLSRDVPFAGTLFVTYWFGRVLTVWLAPLVIRSGGDLLLFMEVLSVRRPLFSRVHVSGAMWAAVVLLVMLAGGEPIDGRAR